MQAFTPIPTVWQAPLPMNPNQHIPQRRSTADVRELKYRILYKTEMCNNVIQAGKCPYGKLFSPFSPFSLAFPQHFPHFFFFWLLFQLYPFLSLFPKKKNQGSRCKFAHNFNELRFVPQEEKLRFGLITWQTYLGHRTQPCQNMLTTGHCPYGTKCCFLHGEDPALESEETRKKYLLCYDYGVIGL